MIGFDVEDTGILTYEENHAVFGCGDHFKTGTPDGGKDCGSFGSFGRFLLGSKTGSGLIFSFIASVAARTTQLSYSWMFSRSIDLFEYQDDHSKLMDEMGFTGIMWTVFAASAAIVLLPDLHFLWPRRAFTQ